MTLTSSWPIGVGAPFERPLPPGRMHDRNGRGTCGLCQYRADRLHSRKGKALRRSQGWRWTSSHGWLCSTCAIGRTAAAPPKLKSRRRTSRRSGMERRRGWDLLELSRFEGDRRLEHRRDEQRRHRVRKRRR